MRRTPATYDRILKHIEGHQITVHCTVTRQQVQRDGYLEEFVRFWSENPDTRQIWVSLYTPQIGEVSDETADAGGSRARRRRADAPATAVSQAADARGHDPGLRASRRRIPDECIFAQTTTCISADFEHQISPCQFGGNPDCSNCGCIASAGLGAVGRHRLPGGLRVGAIFDSRCGSDDGRAAPCGWALRH